MRQTRFDSPLPSPAKRGRGLPRIRLASSRYELVRQLQQQLEQDNWPRLQMSLLVGITGGAGLLASFLFLQAGLDNMALRYPLALACAYLVFLGLLWLWMQTRLEDYVDLFDPDLLSTSSDVVDATFRGGGGGQFAGGGHSGSFDLAGPDPAESSSLGDSVQAAGDAEELAIPLLVLLLALGLVLSLFYVVSGAPVLFAELLVDSLLSAGLYHRLRRIERRHWLESALRRTALPFALTACLLGGIGWTLGHYAPGAHTLGEALHGKPVAEAAP